MGGGWRDGGGEKTGGVDAGAVAFPSGLPAVVAAAWERCRRLGVDPAGGYCHQVLAGGELAARLAAGRELLEVAHTFLAGLDDFLQDCGFVVVLVDREGVVLEIFGDTATCRALATHLNLVPGAVWREENVGNTAISTALLDRVPAQIVGPQHYCRAHHPWATSAAPIMNPEGEIIGVINISGRAEQVHPHTLGMVVAAARAIEGQLAMHRATEELKLQHKYQEAIVESMSDGFLAIDSTGRITYLNASGGHILGVDPQKVIGKFIGDIVDFRPVVLDVLETGQGYVDREFMVTTRNGFKHFVKTAVPIRDENGNITGVVDTFREIKRVRKLVNQMVGAQANFTFADIIGESKELAECLRLARIAAQSSSSVLIQGETGTGKELFAQAIHNASNRRDGPFVAINCAALPREIIESELFGYEEGAFTGASRGGRPGKFELASGGTVFLDEVGEMPLDMQAKVLRVLEEHRVMRLGGNHYIDCDVRIIAATNKNLAREVELGNFRRDLYYRLNVIFISLPPLRQRGKDLDLLVEHLTRQIGWKLGRGEISFTPDALQVLRAYPWPGNVRELKNVIERAINTAQGPAITAPEVMRLLGCHQGPSGLAAEPLSLAELERQAIQRALRVTGGNISQAARLLRISRNTLYNKLKRYRIEAG